MPALALADLERLASGEEPARPTRARKSKSKSTRKRAPKVAELEALAEGKPARSRKGSAASGPFYERAAVESSKQFGQQLAKQLVPSVRVSKRTATAAIRTGATQIGKLGAKLAPLALPIGATAVGAILVGVGAYYGTKWIKAELRARRIKDSYAARKAEMTRGYNLARADAEERLGRELTAEEQHRLYGEFQTALFRSLKGAAA